MKSSKPNPILQAEGSGHLGRFGLLALLATSSLGFAGIVIEENFSYSDADVAGLDGGTGWASAWEAGNAAPPRRFAVIGGKALYQGGGSTTTTEQKRAFAAALTSSETAPIELRFTLLRPESQSGRGIGIYLTNGGANQLFIGKEINDNVGLKSSIATNSTDYAEFSSSAANETITTVITYDGTNTSLVLSDSNETLAAHVIPGTFTFDGISLAGYNGATTTNGIDSFSISDGSNPDPWITLEDVTALTADNATQSFSLAVANAGTTQDLTITSVTPGGADAANFTIDQFPSLITAGGTDYVDFTFTPSGTYQPSYTATFVIVSNDAASPKTVTVNITNRSDPRISAANQTFLNNGVANTYSVQVTNLGLANNLTVGTVVVTGTDAGTISGVTSPAPIAPGATGFIDFTFTPDLGPLPYYVTFAIPSDDLATPSKEISLTFNVRDPIIAVSASALNFGAWPNQPGPQVASITIYNDGGSEDLIIEDTTAITGSEEFAITNTTFPLTIAPNGDATVEVTFTPGSGGGRFSGLLTIVSNASDGTIPKIPLTAFVDPAGTIVSRFDFDPNQIAGTTVDLDGSGMAAWTTGNLTDMATGLGALSTGNQTATNREIASGASGNFLRLSCNRESDAQTPEAPAAGTESTWTTVTVTPQPGGGAIDFTGGTAVIDTYASTDQGSNTAANWTLYYSTDDGTTWTSLGTQAGAATGTTNGLAGPLGLSWDLTPLGNQTTGVQFILDPVSSGGTNGTVGQRGVGFDNLLIAAGSVTPGTTGDYASWAETNGVTGGPAGDSDNDGIQNLVEYALDLDSAGSAGSAGSFDGTTLSFTKRGDAVTNGDVTYAIQTSPDLANWTPVAPGDLEEGSATDPESISFSLPAGQGKLFARLVVTQTDP